ncbi:GDSL esterase/lipase At3g48460-like [Hevea brasiliensis]|nr:GDSL esterase/lipase At3g48460-like [Hevea brasiliensis]
MEGVKSFVGQMFGKSSGQTAQSGRGMSNGRLLIDFLCDDLGLPSIQAYKDAAGNFTAGVNFAIAGSTCLSGDLFASHKITHSLMFKPKPESSLTEIDWFNKFLLSVDCKGKDEAQCKAHLGNSLFWVGALGLSDYARIFGSSISAKSLTEASVDHVGKILKALLERGAKYVVVQGLPPAGCCPLQLLLNPPRERDNMGCSSGLNAVIQAHNDFLQKKLGEVRAQYKDAVIVYADTWNAYKTVLVNYKNFQFEEPFKACCGAGGGLLNFDLHSLCGSTGTSVCKNPQSYISWDGIHFTEAMHKQLAQLFFHQGFCSPSFDALIEAKSKNGPAA